MTTRTSPPTAGPALVTGATSGLGRATAIRLAEAGADLAVVGRSESDLTSLTRDLAGHEVEVVPLVADLADTADLERLVDRAAEELGGLGLLVNAAATDAPGTAEELDLADWERVLAVNLTAPFALSRAAFPHLRTHGRGLVVNVSSVAGRRGWAGASAYCATKFALTGLTQALAAEGRAHDIRVCVLYPGAMATNWGTFDPDQRSVPAGTPEERDALDPAVVADLIVWLATSPGQPVLNEVTVTPLREAGWP